MRTAKAAPTQPALPRGIPYLDFTRITRDATKVRTTVTLDASGGRVPWILCGMADLRVWSEPKRKWRLSAYLKAGTTDFEHDSAYAFCLPLVGVTFESIYYGVTTAVAWIGGDDDAECDFRVPGPGYDPLTLPGTVRCSSCRGKNSHAIVPEHHYQPPPEPGLFALVRGCRVEIVTGVP
jgi:hypothetical protein